MAVQEHVNEWVSTCNYWAARGSKEPLTGGVSNMEYGWGECLADVVLDLDAVQNGDTQVGNSYLNPDQAMLYEWRPPAPPLVSSTLSETEQLHSLQRQLATLTADINAHREVKKKIEVKVCSPPAHISSVPPFSSIINFHCPLVSCSVHQQREGPDQLGKPVSLPPT